MKELSTKIGQTMTTREIAELTGKRHDNVVRDMRSTFKEAGIAIANPERTYLDGKEHIEYRLDNEQTLTLVSGYPTPLRAKVVRRWLELETDKDFYIPKTLMEALQLAADIQQKLQDAQLQIEQYKPLIALSRATSAKGYITRRKWCKRLKHQGCSITERKLTEWLMSEGYCHKDQLTGDTHVYAKYDYLLTLKVELINGYARTLLVVTDAGVRELSAKVLRHFMDLEEI